MQLTWFVPVAQPFATWAGSRSVIALVKLKVLTVPAMISIHTQQRSALSLRGRNRSKDQPWAQFVTHPALIWTVRGVW